jgi:hypothetical protein
MNHSEIACGIYLLGLLVAGWGIAAGLQRRLLIERLSLAAAIGPAAIGLCLIFISMLGQRPTMPIIFFLCAGMGSIAIFQLRKTRSSETIAAAPIASDSQISPYWMLTCAVAIGYALFVVTFDAIAQPTIEYDAFAIWQFKAKILASAALRPRPAYFSDVSLSFSHLRYPLLIPMISAGVHAVTGTLTSGLEKSPALLLFLAMGAGVYAAIRRQRSAVAALTATTLFLTLPMMLKYAGSGTAEIGIAAFWTCSIAAILRWQQNQNFADLLLAAFFSVALAWTKNEGLALAAVNAFVILFCTPKPFARKNLAATLAFAAIVAVFYSPWLIYTRGLPQTDENYLGHLRFSIIAANINRLPRICTALLEEAGQIYHWGIFLMALPVLAIYQYKRLTARPVVTLWILLLLHLSCYLLAYIITPLPLTGLLATTSYRLLLNVSPAAALLIGFLWPEEGYREESVKTESLPIPTAQC